MSELGKPLSIERVQQLARGRPGAMRVHENHDGVFVERWKPRLAGGFVALDNAPSNYATSREAVEAATEVKRMAQRTIRTPQADRMETKQP